MIDQLIDAIHKVKDYNRLHAYATALWDELGRVQLENVQLRQENRVLRRRLKDDEFAILRRAGADATLMGALHFGGASTSRRAMQPMIGHRRWGRACALLKLARIHNGAYITAAACDEFFKALDLAQKRVQRDGMGAMNDRLPLCQQQRSDRRVKAY